MLGGVRRLPVGGPITELSDLRDGSGLFLLRRSLILLHTLCAIAVCLGRTSVTCDGVFH